MNHHNVIWKVICDLYKYRKKITIRNMLCQRLYQIYDSSSESFYVLSSSIRGYDILFFE